MKRYFSKVMQCFVDEIAYDPRIRRGTLRMPSGSCCDMGGCVETFRKAFPEVQVITTLAGGERDTEYERRDDGKWRAKSWNPFEKFWRHGNWCEI